MYRGAAEVWALLLPFPQWRGRDGRLRPRQRFLVHPAPVHGHVACGEPGVALRGLGGAGEIVVKVHEVNVLPLSPTKKLAKWKLN